MGASGVSDWLDALRDHDALPTRLLAPPDPAPDLTAITNTPYMTVTPELTDLFATVTGYDQSRVRVEEARYTGPPHIVGEMPIYAPWHGPIPAGQLAGHIRDREFFGLSYADQSYLGIGFVPFGQEYNGEFLFVNANENSPTFGAVYTLSEGIGSHRLADNLPAYFAGLIAMLQTGAIFIDAWGRVEMNVEDLLDQWPTVTGQAFWGDGTRDW